VKRLLPLLSAAALLAGCAAAPPLQRSSSPDAAKVRFISTATAGSLWVYPQDRCSGGVEVVTNTSATAAPTLVRTKARPPRTPMYDEPFANDDERVAAYALEPGQLLNLGAVGPACMRGTSVRLKPGEQYEVVLATDCRIHLYQLVPSAGPARREPVRKPGPLICEKPPR